jgi:cytochrome c oxidase cbb3-type subunit 3
MNHPKCVIGFSALILVISPSPAQQGDGGATQAVQAGESRFISQCGFCHGRDAQGGETGPDLTRSPLVAEDVRGDKLQPLILSGRPAAGMPAFSLPTDEIAAIVAFLHDARSKAESTNWKRRSVDVEDLQTGNAEAGKRYFNGAGGCAKCHSLSGSFSSVGARFQGLALLQRMLYPRNRGPRPSPDQPLTTITTASGQTISGKLAYRDEFTITIVDADDWTHSFLRTAVKIEGDDPLEAHAEQLGKYTDEEMHNMFAYLQTLK